MQKNALNTEQHTPYLMSKPDYIAIRKEVRRLEKNKKGYIKYIKDTFNLQDNSEAKQLYRDLTGVENEEDLENFEITSSADKESEMPMSLNEYDGIIDCGGYVYNRNNDKYIVPLTSYGNDYVCPGDQHRAMQLAYTRWAGKESSLAEIARVYNMEISWVKEYFRIMQWTHDSLPVTNEELSKDGGKAAIDRALHTKRAAWGQELETADWIATQKDAEQWQQFKLGKLDPLTRVLERYEPKPFDIPKCQSNDNLSNETLLIGLSDLHFGAVANPSELYRGQKFNKDVICEIIKRYSHGIQQEIANRKQPFKEVCICGLGDILHTLNGFTTKGTPLETDVLREDQFELALNSLTTFFIEMLKTFPKVSVHAVKGNHAGYGDWILFRAISIHFKDNPNITFNLPKSRHTCFRIGNTAILMEHGASDISKSMVPSGSSPKKAYINQLFLLSDINMQGVKTRLMIQGDRHRYFHEECGSFEHVIMGSCVSGDRYADNLGLHSRARQNCLILTDDGVKESISFYFDKL